MIDENFIKFSESVKKSFSELDVIVKASPLTDEQMKSILKTKNGLQNAIKNQDENEIMKHVKQYLDGTNN